MNLSYNNRLFVERIAKACLFVWCASLLMPSPFASAQTADPVLSGSQQVLVHLSGARIDEYLIAETPNFLNSNWTPFEGEEVIGTTSDGTPIERMTVLFTLSPGDGDKTIYIKYRTDDGVQTSVITQDVTLDEANSCLVDPLTGCEGLPLTPISLEERLRYKLGISPTSGENVPTSFIYPGDYVRSNEYDTVYCITTNLERRPFIDEITFFTQTRTFFPVKWASEATVRQFPLNFPMLPREGVALMKFEDEENVYYFIQDLQNPNRGFLHWITTPELATYIAGENWADYVIDLNPGLRDRFDFISPFVTEEDVLAANIDLDSFRQRELLNEASAADSDPGVESSLIKRAGAFISNAFRSIVDRFNSIENPFKKD